MNNNKTQFLTRNISNESKDFQDGANFGANETIDEALLLIQSKLGYYSPVFAIIKKILSDMKSK